MEHSEVSDVKNAMTIATTDKKKNNTDSSEIMKESVMEELDTNAMGSAGKEATKVMTTAMTGEMKNTVSSEIMKESAMEGLETSATGNLGSSKVIQEFAMEGKLTSNDMTRYMLHSPIPPPIIRRDKWRRGKCECYRGNSKPSFILVFKPREKIYCRICHPRNRRLERGIRPCALNIPGAKRTSHEGGELSNSKN